MGTTTATTDRTVAGRAFPQPGTYAIDPSHSSVEAVARHMIVSKVRGLFGSFSGSIVVGEEPASSKVEVSIDAKSIDTRDEQRDQHLRSPDFLDVDNHPTLDFVSTEVQPDGDTWKVTGDLTIRGQSRPATLDVTYLGMFEDPFGNTKAAFTATTELEREQWGITWNQALETGGVLVGKTLKVELEVQAARA